MLQQIICSGFGGQGVLTTGMLIAFAGHHSGNIITWYPSYGSEMRGGTANCMIKISDEEIASPYVKEIDILITLNDPAITKFEASVKPGGWLFANSALVDENRTFRDDINVVKVDAEKLAEEAGNPKGANIALVGAVLKKTGFLTYEQYRDAMNRYFTDKGKAKFNELNEKALLAGYNSL